MLTPTSITDQQTRIFTSMKTTRPVTALPLLILVAFLFHGCATDPVGKAEQTTSITADSFDGFLQFEVDHRGQLKALNPQIYTFAQKLRHRECPTCPPNGVRYLQTARSLTETYRLNRTPENKANMQTAIATVTKFLSEALGYLTQAQQAGINPPPATVSQIQVAVKR